VEPGASLRHSRLTVLPPSAFACHAYTLWAHHVFWEVMIWPDTSAHFDSGLIVLAADSPGHTIITIAYQMNIRLIMFASYNNSRAMQI
jgi:hypothetical protein